MAVLGRLSGEGMWLGTYFKSLHTSYFIPVPTLSRKICSPSFSVNILHLNVILVKPLVYQVSY